MNQRIVLIDDDELQAEYSRLRFNQLMEAIEIEVHSNWYESADEAVEEPADVYILDHDLNGTMYSTDVIDRMIEEEWVHEAKPDIFILSGSRSRDIKEKLESRDVHSYVDEIYSKHNGPYEEIAEKLDKKREY